MIQRYSQKGKHARNITLVYTVSKEDGLIPSVEYWKKTASANGTIYQFFSEDTSNYNVIRRNMFAYNPARLNIGSIGCLYEK